jgi:uncharacterized protein YbaP (TraB family)
MRSSFVRFALTIGLGLLFAGAAFADPPTPMLWKVTKGTNTVYLLGSMHLLKNSDNPLSPDVDAAYKDASKLVFEIPPDDLTSIAGVAIMLKYSTYQDPTRRLQDDLQPATWKKLVAYGAKNNLPVEKLQTLEPWTVSQVVLVLESMKMGIRQDDGLDMHFMKMAAADHKSTAGFETIEQQVQLLHAAPLKVQEDMLRQSLDEIADFPKEMTEEHDTWRRGDGDAMVALAKKEYAKYPDLYRQMIAERNSNWIPQIEKLLDDGKGDTLVIVGALHLPGSDGVVHLLREKGYSVERICTGCATVKH